MEVLKPGQPLLIQPWVDIVSIVSLVLTTVGAALSWIAMRQARSAAKAAKEAAAATERRNQSDFRNYIITIAREQLHELEGCIEKADWNYASRRANELADAISQLTFVSSDTQDQLIDICNELREWSSTFKRIGAQKTRFADQKWGKFRASIIHSLGKYFGPFAKKEKDGAE